MPQTLETPGPQAIAFEECDESSRHCMRIPTTACTLNGFRTWASSAAFPTSGCVSFLAGAIEIDMSPEELVTHNQVRRGLYFGWEQFLREFPLGELIIDGMMFVNEEADLGTEPDGLLCLWESLRSGKVRYREVVEDSERFVEVVGAPDIAAEVVSRSSVHKDKVELLDLYYRANVSEYWLIDARRAEMEFRILTRGPAAFQDQPADGDGFVYSPVLRAGFRMTRDRNPVGGWQYALQWRISEAP